MAIEVIITSVGYADFLEITLPRVSKIFSSINIVTSPDDLQTRKLASKYGCHVHLTKVWQNNGATFNKSAAINECIDAILASTPDCWILLLDADIFFPENFKLDVSNLDPRGLYSVRRRTCSTQKEWTQFEKGIRNWKSLPLDIPPVINQKVWGGRPTSNPAGLCGYFQLFNPKSSSGAKRVPKSKNASKYDVEFALTFPQESRFYLSGKEVLHLGESKKNWDGRQTALWTSSKNK